MRPSLVAATATISLLLGAGFGFAAKYKGAGIEVFRNKPDKEAGLAALKEAEQLANGDSGDLIAVGRVYYLMGDEARGQVLFDYVTNRKPDGRDFERIAAVYAEADENDKASAAYEKALSLDPKDDSNQAEVGAWYMRIGQRAKGEALLAKALQRSPNESSYYIRAAESLLAVPAGR